MKNTELGFADTASFPIPTDDFRGCLRDQDIQLLKPEFHENDQFCSSKVELFY